MNTKPSLAEWLNKEIRKRGWTQAELARRSGITSGQVSHVMSESRGAGPEFCTAIAYGLNESPEKIFRIAGLLPEISEDVARFAELKHFYSQISDIEKDIILAQVRALAGRNREEKPSTT